MPEREAGAAIVKAALVGLRAELSEARQGLADMESRFKIPIWTVKDTPRGTGNYRRLETGVRIMDEKRAHIAQIEKNLRVYLDCLDNPQHRRLMHATSKSRAAVVLNGT